ncbi:hypothetical protein EV127DRAFT_406882 [Xylaria flabelliformis]|nr:hypothetical protein EV127DRAFT_406882 [Xylaria flabelliformis]
MFESEKLLRKVKIKACVVWDTVSNLGLPRPWAKPMSFVGNVVPQAVENAFQALALDETRAQFRPCIWEKKEDEDTYVKQCWFLGSHSDVGGNGDAPLGAVTLIWMIAQLQNISNVKFNQDEIKKHLKHRFLEWDIDMNWIFGQLQQKAILSQRPNSGQTTRSSPLWWLSGFKRRTVDMMVNDDPDLDIPAAIHFTVRLSMFYNLNQCRVLRKWETVRRDGRIYWQKQDKKLIEDMLEGSGGYEYAILKSWSSEEPPLPQTDRTRFAMRLRIMLYDSREGPHGNLGRFAVFLRDKAIFNEENIPAPGSMYLPRHRFAVLSGRTKRRP